MVTILASHPVSKEMDDDSADLPDDLVVPALQTALLIGDIVKAATLASRIDPWLAAHMSDLFDKLGLLKRPEEPYTSPRRSRMLTSSSGAPEADRRKPEGDQSLRDFCVLSYGETLRSDPGLWRLVVEYFASCDGPEGLGRAKAVLRRVVVDADDRDMIDETDAGMDMDLDIVSAVGGTVKETTDVKREREKAGKRPTVKDVTEMCHELGLKDEALRLSKVRVGPTNDGPPVETWRRADQSGTTDEGAKVWKRRLVLRRRGGRALARPRDGAAHGRVHPPRCVVCHPFCDHR